jgi:hypothetical protein
MKDDNCNRNSTIHTPIGLPKVGQSPIFEKSLACNCSGKIYNNSNKK